MKRNVWFLAAILMMALVTGCGSSKGDEKLAELDEKVQNTEETSTSKTKKKAATTTKKKADTEEKVLELVRGTITDGVYQNTSTQIQIPLQEGMIAYSDEEIVNLLDLGKEMISESGAYSIADMEERMQGAMYDAVLWFADGESNVAIIYENTTVSKQESQDAKSYAETLKSELSKVEELSFEVGEVTEETIDNKKFAVVPVHVGDFAQKYYVCQCENYMIEFIFTYTQETESQVEALIQDIKCSIKE